MLKTYIVTGDDGVARELSYNQTEFDRAIEYARRHNRTPSEALAEVRKLDAQEARTNPLPSEEVDRLAREYALEHRVDVVTAQRQVLKQHPGLARAYHDERMAHGR
jgi:hypothetical protein